MNRPLVRYAGKVAWQLMGFAAVLLLAFVLFPRLGEVHVNRKSDSDLSNIKQMGIAHLMYMEDNDGNGPPPNQWMDALRPYVKHDPIFTSPGLDADAGEHGYAYLEELGPIRESDVLNPSEVPTLFNSYDLRLNATGGLELLPAMPRWGEFGNNIGFLDSHATAHKTAPLFTIELP